MTVGHAFDVFFTGVSPQKLRLLMLNSDPSEVGPVRSPAQFTFSVWFLFELTVCWSAQSVLVSVFYSNPQRLDVYVQNVLVAPTNAAWNNDRTDYTLRSPTIKGGPILTP